MMDEARARARLWGKTLYHTTWVTWSHLGLEARKVFPRHSSRTREELTPETWIEEAINGFNALLTDLIRTPDYSWKEAKKLLKKDSRWDMIEGNLEKSERERLFDDHIDHLIGESQVTSKISFKISFLFQLKRKSLTEAFWRNTKTFLSMLLSRISRKK